MEQTIRVAEIEVSQAQDQQRIIGMFRYRDEKLGSKSPELFLMADIDSSLYVYEQLLDALNDAAERVFRQLSSTTTDPMARFEKIIKRLNDAVKTFTESEPSELNWSRVSLYALELHDRALCVSGIGHLSNAFLQKTEKGYLTFDLLGSLDTPAIPDPSKIFASLVCGDMKPGDLFFAGTSNFERIRGELDLINRLKTLPPVSAALEITQDLERLNLQDDFAGIVVSCSAVTSRPTSEQKPLVIKGMQSAQSMQQLYKQEKSTEHLLQPSIVQQTELEITEYEEGENEPDSNEQKKSFSLVSTFLTFKDEWKNRKQSPIVSLGKDPTTLAGMRNTSAGHGTLLNKRRQPLLIVLGILVIVGLGIGWSIYQKQQKLQAAWLTSFTQASDKKTRAESSLLYGNEQGARTLLTEAKSIASSLNESTTEQTQKKSTLLSEIEALMTKTRRVITATPTQLTQASIGAAAGSLRTPVLLKDTLYLVDQSSQSVLSLIPGQTTSQRISLPTSTIDITAAAAGASTIYFAQANGGLIAVNGTQATTAGTVGTEPISAMTIYNKRLYALHGQNGTITRHDASGTGFGSGTDYLKQTSKPLSGSTGIAIDSSVFVSWSDGTLKKYLSGAEESWKNSTPEPAASSLQSLWTDTSDADRLVAADPQGKRLLVWRKSDGAFIGQITAPVFTGPTAVVGDGLKKKLYVIDNNILWQVDLP